MEHDGRARPLQCQRGECQEKFIRHSNAMETVCISKGKSTVSTRVWEGHAFKSLHPKRNFASYINAMELVCMNIKAPVTSIN